MVIKWRRTLSTLQIPGQLDATEIEVQKQESHAACVALTVHRHTHRNLTAIICMSEPDPNWKHYRADLQARRRNKKFACAERLATRTQGEVRSVIQQPKEKNKLFISLICTLFCSKSCCTQICFYPFSSWNKTLTVKNQPHVPASPVITSQLFNTSCQHVSTVIKFDFCTHLTAGQHQLQIKTGADRTKYSSSQ